VQFHDGISAIDAKMRRNRQTIPQTSAYSKSIRTFAFNPEG
jgi:hypothetical protein